MGAMHEALGVPDDGRRARDEFLARMSHELRTPLNAVIGFARVLESNRAGNQRPEDIDLLSRVRANGERLLHLVEGVLDQAVLERGELALEIGETDVARVATGVIAKFQPAANAKAIRLHALVPRHPCVADLDAARFAQVVHHLVDNAVKFTHAGEISVIIVTDAATRRPARLVVSDTGIGIAQDKLDLVFSPFEQVDPSTTRAHEGAGLGLPLARQLCEAMGCTLSAESELNRGSRFTIRFPVRGS
jgi:signal transduction histidine kinase